MGRLAKFPPVYAVLLALGLASFTAPASASSGEAAADGPSMRLGGLTSQPVGHYDFCRRYKQQCRAAAPAAPLPLNAQNRRLLEQVNLSANDRIAPATDMEVYGREEYWEYPDKAGWRGDCEDYALLKQRELQNRGIAPANLLITVVRKPNGEAHAVLTVRTDKGDMILDNLRDQIRNWRNTDYRYIKRQSEANASQWVEIAPRAQPPVAMAMAGRRNYTAGTGATQAIAAPVPARKPGR